ncbi:glycosyltransferase family 1 protein [Methylotenera sp.]|uniref:glycosyltransferase family 4 protein n=1 Tax=Methylotenera sp. TaxID=2051956 RepID=UPI0024897849|nr:glycosyltransferase family 1 protein [Methylotenera sp.]MDI1361132.1 glycosyltransferase family 1 protein [Methylotenera sp.]
MNIVLFSHPAFMNSQSMPRFARMLEEAYRARGHQVEVWSPQAKMYALLPKGRLSKWAGYIDQYIIFPLWVRKQLKMQPANTLYVFCDQALGPWVPLVKNKPHVVHVHDLLALRSALGDIPENPTQWSGRVYQRYIRQGFQQAKHFISISKKTRDDLHHFGEVTPVTSEVVYNGLNYPYVPMLQSDAIAVLKQAGLPVKPEGMLLHLGGSQWYKNLAGVVRLYIEYAKGETKPLPLWCISPSPNTKVQALLKELPAQGQVLFFQGIDNQALQAAYSTAHAFIFPSLAEGFGWPIIEAQASGCLVLTTDAAPMNEIGGSSASYIPLLRLTDDPDAWALKGSNALKLILNMPEMQRITLVEQGLAHAAKFNADDAIEGYLKTYQQVLSYTHTAQILNNDTLIPRKAR